MFSLVKKSVVNIVDDFKIGNGARVLAWYFSIKRDKLLPLLKPAFGDEINRHSFHDGSVVIVFLEELCKLIFLVVDDLARMYFRGFELEWALSNGLDLIDGKKMVLIEIFGVLFHPSFDILHVFEF
jgi:hypothetical protein